MNWKDDDDLRIKKIVITCVMNANKTGMNKNET